MDPYYEQRLREEVIYLHSLWHQGPPPKNPNPNPTSLHPSNTTHFKKRGNRAPGKRNKTQTESLDSGIEWPCKIAPESPPVTDSGWPSVWAPSKSEPRSLTAEEQARLVSGQAQKAALKAVCEFLSHTDNSDESDDESDDDCIDEVEEEEEGCTKLEFFVKMFKDDIPLREYYEKNNAGGEFSCLVCYAVGKRGWKKYKDCVALVQHSVSITKTKSKLAHRAYGQAICEVLGWDINRLPSSIVSGQENDIGSGKDALNVPGANTELTTINIDGPKGSANNENSGANNGGSVPLELYIVRVTLTSDNHVNDNMKLPDCIKDVVNVNTSEVRLQNESTNNENLQENIGS